MSEIFAQILIPNALNDDFTYLADSKNNVGDIVLVEFGRQKIWGLIAKISDNFQHNFDKNKIKKILETHHLIKLSPQQLKFIEQIASYNLASRGLVLKSFIGILNSDKIKKEIQPLQQIFEEKKLSLKELSPSQYNAFEAIKQSTSQAETFLLQGVTGSGKTEIYFAVIADILKKNPAGQILILLPEIALTSQLLSRFSDQFGFSPALWHSKISKSQKREIYYAVATGSLKLMIGARSSLLLPFKNLKLIVIDEEHDNSFKQEDIFNFHARDMAILRSKIENFPVILSTATPAVETFHNATIQKFQSFRLDEKFGATNLIEYIDLRQEKLENGQILSAKLSAEIAKNIANKKQILLFLNRRGYSPVTICKSCGNKYDCQNCDFHLVHHKNKNLLICHHCGHQEKPPNKCKFCGEENSLISVGFGVEKLHEEVKLKFPDANVAMVNSDEIKNFDDAEKIINEISCGTIDIIIGTQMISKGYDFPNLNLVGVIDVDSLLYSSDLRALEKSYQILTQVMGRAGRSKDSGKILIQTYNPKNLLFQIINSDNRNAFYDFEINNRQTLNLPPFSQMIKIEISALKENIAKEYAKSFISYFPIDEKIELFGPAPAPIQKLKNRHHFLIHVKAHKKVNLQKLINDVRLQIKSDPKIKIRFNINP